MRSFALQTQSSALGHRSDSGDPAVIELSLLRPVTLRPYLSIGLPFYRMLQLRLYAAVATVLIICSHYVFSNIEWLCQGCWFRYTPMRLTVNENALDALTRISSVCIESSGVFGDYAQPPRCQLIAAEWPSVDKHWRCAWQRWRVSWLWDRGQACE